MDMLECDIDCRREFPQGFIARQSHWLCFAFRSPSTIKLLFRVDSYSLNWSREILCFGGQCVAAIVTGI
jgi:hypothetical protein